MSRLEYVTECKHGFLDPHNEDPSGDYRSGCDGGSRTPLDPDRKIVVLHRWRELTVQDVLDTLEDTDGD